MNKYQQRLEDSYNTLYDSIFYNRRTIERNEAAEILGKLKNKSTDIIKEILSDQDKFVDWVGTNYVKLRGGWIHRYSDQRDPNKILTTDKLREIYQRQLNIIPK